MHQFKGTKVFILGFAILVLISLIWIGISFLTFLKTPLLKPGSQFGQSIVYVLKPGADAKILARDLHAQGLLSHPFYLETLAIARGITHRLQSGEYQITDKMTVEQLLRHMVAGKVLMHSITIPEGWTFAKMVQALEQNPALTHTLQGQDTASIMTQLGYPGQNPEGLFFPATYSFKAGTADTLILQEAYKTMQTRLNKAWQNRAANLPYKTPYDSLIVASLIEKETALREERPVVSGVILRRLQQNMLLQIDPTVIYGLGNQFSGKLTTADLKANSAYNTYQRKGLPPTPICLPSLSSIEAALHPVLGTYLYFVATGYGGHFFSANLQDHAQAVKAYRNYEGQQQHAQR